MQHVKPDDVGHNFFPTIGCSNSIVKSKQAAHFDSEFAKDVSLIGYTDEILLNEVDGMTNILYEKQSSFLERQDAKALEVAHNLYNQGKLTPNENAEVSGVPVKNIRRWKRRASSKK